MLSVGTLIWVSLRPLLRLAICVLCGFGLTKADRFPVVASRGAGQIVLNVALPCLMFSKIVPAFTPDNISALGPLVLVSIIYMVLGILLAWTIKQFFWVPHRFRYGIIVAGGWGNIGDIPNAVALSITGAAPFNGVQDQNLAVAYIAAFILVFFVTLFPLGGHRMLMWDFVGPDVEDDEVKEAMVLKRKAFFSRWTSRRFFLKCRRASRHDEEIHAVRETSAQLELRDSEKNDSRGEKPTSPRPSHSLVNGRHVSFQNDDATTTAVPTETVGSPTATEPITSRVASPTPSLLRTETLTNVQQLEDLPTPTSSGPSASEPSQQHPRLPTRFLYHFRAFLSSLLSPCSMSIILSLIIALLTPLKALFVPLPSGSSSHVHIPPAPDGQPPLAFVIDTATFIGGASVPVGLVCLGSALARLDVPARRGRWRGLPVGAIGALAVGKIVVGPVVGVLVCQGLTRVGVMDAEDRVLRFVCIFISCLPTATTQVYITQVYSGTGNAEHIAAFLLPQYALMCVVMVVLTAYSINLIF